VPANPLLPCPISLWPDLANEFAEAVKAVTSELEGDPEESFAEEQEEAEEQKETA